MDSEVASSSDLGHPQDVEAALPCRPAAGLQPKSLEVTLASFIRPTNGLCIGFGPSGPLLVVPYTVSWRIKLGVLVCS